MSGASNARFLNIFEPFPAILRHLEVENFWKKHQKVDILNLNFRLPGMWFSKNRQKSLSAVAKSFLRIAWCCKLYQKIAWTLRSIFYMNNVRIKCLEKILRAENQVSLTFKKAFFDFRFWILTVLEYEFLKIDKNVS